MNDFNRNQNSELDASDPSTVDADRESSGRASELVNEVAAKARELLPDSDVGDVVEDAGRSIADAASYMRQKADNMATAVGGALEHTGNYLREDGINKITTELTTFVRRNPIPALCAGVAVGFLIAQLMHRRSDEYPHVGDVHG